MYSLLCESRRRRRYIMSKSHAGDGELHALYNNLRHYCGINGGNNIRSHPRAAAASG